MNVKVRRFFPHKKKIKIPFLIPIYYAVCVKTVETFANSLDEDTKKDTKLIEEAFRKFCKTSKNKEHRFVSPTNQRKVNRIL